MKTLLPALLILLLASCTKEKDLLVGRWTLSDASSCLGSIQPPPNSIKFALYEGGRFEMLQYDSTQYYSPLAKFNHYHKLDNETIIFYNDQTSEQQRIQFYLTNELSLGVGRYQIEIFSRY